MLTKKHQGYYGNSYQYYGNNYGNTCRYYGNNYGNYVLKTEDIHPSKTGTPVHFPGSLTCPSHPINVLTL